MKLKDIIKNIEKKRTQNFRNIEVEGITHDSRKVRENFIFVALKGTKQDGHNFINDAIERGAKVLIVNRKSIVLPQDVVEIVVDDTRKVLHQIASIFYQEPSKKLKVCGITGTNGKTTTSFLIKKLLEKAGYKCGLIGTISYQIGERVISSENTTPESADIQELLNQMVEEKCQWCVMEVSSHGIDQERIAEIHFDVAVFTNILPHEHLDYHKSFKNYLKTKLLLFSKYLVRSEKKEKYGIINLDDPNSKYFIKALKREKIDYITYGKNQNGDVKLIEYSIKREGSYFKVKIDKEEKEFFIKLRGMGNIYNALTTITFSISQKIPIEIVSEALAEMETVPGRFEFIEEGQPFDVIVDYAHTHHALKNLLLSIKEMKPRKIIVVFGCGGDRDKSKRPLMGNVAVKLADFVFLTSDNPRSEEPMEIIEDIEKGIPFYYRKKYVAIPDRRRAIKEAISLAKEGDCVVIAGKGHETYQILKDVIVPFDDKEEARKAIREIYGAGENK